MITCNVCGATEFQLIRDETMTSVKFVDNGTVSEWFPNDEPSYVEEAWSCVSGHVPDWEQDAKLTLLVTQNLLDSDLRETPPCPWCGHREHLLDVCEQDMGEFGECPCADTRPR